MKRYRATCDCGYDHTAKTRGIAEHFLGRHSCETQRERIARRERRLARLASSGEVRDCNHPIARHEHGTRQAYALDKCRCRPCRNAASQYERERERLKLYGRWDHRVDAEPVRGHLRALSAAGIGWKRAADLAGVNQSTTSTLLFGRHDRRNGAPAKTVRRDVAERLLAVAASLDTLSEGAVVDHAGTTRRLQALVALGWSQSKLGRRLGVGPSNMTPLMQGRRDVQVATAKAVRALYAELSMRLPPQEAHRDRIAASRARSHAKRNGWLPPLALDDERLDDPDYTPLVEQSDDEPDALDHAAIWRCLNGDRTVRLTPAERAEVVHRWRAEGVSRNEIERRTGWKVERYTRRGEVA